MDQTGGKLKRANKILRRILSVLTSITLVLDIVLWTTILIIIL